MEREPLHDLLHSTDCRVLHRAIQAVTTMGMAAQSAIPALQTILSDPGLSRHWEEAYNALRQIPGNTLDGAPELIDRLRRPDEASRISAAYLLGRLGSAASEAVPILTKLLSEGTAKERIRYAAALVRITEDMSFLNILFDDPDVELFLSVLQSLGRLNRPGIEYVQCQLERRLEALLAGSDESQLAESVRLFTRLPGHLSRGLFQKMLRERVVSAARLLHFARAVFRQSPRPEGQYAIRMMKNAMARIGQGDQEAVPDLIEVIRDPALGQLEVPGPKPPDFSTIYHWVLENRFGVRMAASEALGRIGVDAAEAAPAVLELLRTVKALWTKRAPLLHVVARVNPTALAEYLDATAEVTQDDWQILLRQILRTTHKHARAQNEVVRALIWLLNSQKHLSHWDSAIRKLGEIGRPAVESVPHLLRIGVDIYCWDLVLPALRRIGLGISEAAEALKPKLHDTGNPMLQLQVALHLAQNNQLVPESIATMIPQLRNSTPSLWRNVPNDIRKSASYYTDDPPPTIKEVAVVALTSLGPIAAPAVPRLLELLNDPEPRICLHVLDALSSIGIAAAEAAPALRQLLLRSEPTIKFAAATALVNIGCANKEVESVLIDLLRKQDQGLKIHPNFPYLLSKLDARQRGAMPVLLNYFRDDRSVNDIQLAVSGLKRADVGVDAVATVGVALRNLIDARDDGDVLVWTLFSIGKASELIPLLKSRKESVRSIAARALGNFGASASEAIPDLMQCLNDPSQSVQSMANFALYQIRGDCVRNNAPPPFESRWRTSTVVDISRAIRQERGFDRMPILADALMDAGCDSEPILTHCRRDGLHVADCWVLGLILSADT